MPSGVYKRKLSGYWLGKKFSQVHKEKIGEAGKGKKLSKATRKKISKAHIGMKKPWAKPLPHFFGSRNSNWRGGITPLVDKIRHCLKYRQWRSDIFTRDDYTCQLCGKRGGGRIEADHYPKMFSEIFYEYKIKSLEEALVCEEFWNLNSGRTLCKNCHDKTKGRKAKSVIKELEK